MSSLRFASCCRSYEFPGDDIPIVKGSALVALEDGDKKMGHDSILELMKAVDDVHSAAGSSG